MAALADDRSLYDDATFHAADTMREPPTRREQIVDALKARSHAELGAAETSMNRLVADDPYDWDAVSALDQIEKLRQVAIDNAVRERARQS